MIGRSKRRVAPPPSCLKVVPAVGNGTAECMDFQKMRWGEENRDKRGLNGEKYI